jgi:hypothetical protein
MIGDDLVDQSPYSGPLPLAALDSLHPLDDPHDLDDPRGLDDLRRR